MIFFGTGVPKGCDARLYKEDWSGSFEEILEDIKNEIYNFSPRQKF